MLTAVTGLLYAKAGFANFISSNTTRMFAPFAEQKIRLEFSALQEKLSYEEMLSSKNKDRSSLIDQGLWAFNNFFNSSVSSLINIVSLSVVSASFFAIPGLSYVGAGLLVSAIPVAMSNINRNFERLWVTSKLIYKQREVWSGQSAISDPGTVATYRHFKATDTARDIYKETHSEVTEAHSIVNKREVWSNALVKAQSAFATIWATYIAYNFLTAGTPISTTLYTIGMIAVFQGALHTLAEDVTRLLNDGAHLNPFYKFKNELKASANSVINQQLKSDLQNLAPQITVTNLTKSYKTTGKDGKEELSAQVLNIPSLTIEAGAVIGICGEMGSGKSTFMKLLAGLIEPTTGGVSWKYPDGSVVDPAKLSEDQRESVTMCLQQGGFHFERLSVRELLGLAHIKNPNSSISMVEASKLTNLDQVIESAPNGVDSKIGYGWIRGWVPSGGQGRMINIAQVVMSDCPIIIFDEPTANLDKNEKANFTDVIIPMLRSLGKTVFIVSHTYGDLSYTDKVLVFSKGAIHDSGSPNILASRPGEYRDGALQEVNRALQSFNFKACYDENGRLVFQELKD